MADPQPYTSRKLVEPSLKDVLDLWKKDIMLSLNCHAIAKVQSFDPTKQTVSATIMYKKSFLQRDPNGNYVPVLRDYPILLDVPAIVLSGGSAHLTFPIAPGDECLILFNDRDIDNWFQSGQVGELSSTRLHSFSDGIALVGLNSLASLIQNYDSTRAVLRNGDAMVGVSATQIKIANNITTLNTLLGDLIDAINNIATTNAVIGVPCLISPASQAALTAIKVQIAGLLE